MVRNDQPNPRLMFSCSIPENAESSSKQAVSIAGNSRNGLPSSNCITSRNCPMRTIISADNRSRTLPPIRETSDRVEARLSARFPSVITEINSCSSSSEVGGLFLALGSLLCRDSRQLCSRRRQPSSACSARLTRGITERKMRATFSARSAYRPNQKALSATLLGTACEVRCNSSGSLRGRSILKVSTGLSQRTHASLLWPPRCIETTGPSASATRTNPPGIAIHPLPVLSTYVRSTTLRELRHPLSHTGAVDKAICSCATYSCGRARNCPANLPFSGCLSSAPKTGSMPRDGNAGFTTTESRWSSTQSSASVCPHHQVATDGSLRLSPSRCLERP